MAFRFRKAPVIADASSRPSGGWYADPYGAASRRWYDNVKGWTDRVQGAGLEPDKTGVARVDAATDASESTNVGGAHPDLKGGSDSL
jgi:hypothetical protein